MRGRLNESAWSKKVQACNLRPDNDCGAPLTRITFPKGAENAEANRSFVGVYFTVFSIP